MLKRIEKMTRAEIVKTLKLYKAYGADIDCKLKASKKNLKRALYTVATDFLNVDINIGNKSLQFSFLGDESFDDLLDDLGSYFENDCYVTYNLLGYQLTVCQTLGDLYEAINWFWYEGFTGLAYYFYSGEDRKNQNLVDRDYAKYYLQEEKHKKTLFSYVSGISGNEMIEELQHDLSDGGIMSGSEFFEEIAEMWLNDSDNQIHLNVCGVVKTYYVF